MKKTLRFFAVSSMVFYSLVFSTFPEAVDLGSMGDRIFQFQQKMANKGDKLAQYKLGILHEFGVSVEVDLETAKQWYQKSANQKYEPAVNRLIFLDVKQHGFEEGKHREWFERVVKRADDNKPDALILLGQMNRDGIVVEKNLDLALALLQRASSLGHTEVDSQIDELKRKIRENEGRPGKRNIKGSNRAMKKTPAGKVLETSAIGSDESGVDRLAARLRYQQVMQKLQREARLIQQQQEWAESGLMEE